LEDIKGGFESFDIPSAVHPRYLHVDQPESRNGARRKLAVKTLYLLVVGTAWIWPRTDRLRSTLTVIGMPAAGLAPHYPTPA
jgi:hypothetical protein